MFQGKEWGTVLRFWADDIHGAYRNLIEWQDPSRSARLGRTVGPTMHGASIIMVISLLERLVLDCLRRGAAGPVAEVRLAHSGWRGQLGLSGSWDGWSLLEGVVSLRNCFAHEYGRITARQSQPIQDFPAELAAGGVKVTLVN